MHLAFKTSAFSALILAAAACGSGSSTTAGTGGTSATGTMSTSGTQATTTTTGNGGATTTTGNGGGSTTDEKACGDQANALCALRDMCSPGFDVKDVYGSDTVCQERNKQSCLNNLNGTGTGNSATHVEACSMAYPSEACSDFFDGNPVAACVPPAGTLATGAACGASAQCASTYCAVTQYTVCGTCQPLPVAGATCQVTADCGRDLGCAIPSGATSGTCTPFLASGGACLTGTTLCANSFSCVGDDPTTSTMGMCQTNGTTVGAACDGSRKTMPACNNSMGLVCIPTAAGSAVGTCQNITFVGSGKTCGTIGTPETSFVDCSAGGLCQKAAPTDKTGTCVEPAMDAMPCNQDPSIGPPCLAPSKCVVPAGSAGTAGTCTFPNPTTCM
jgi:hypothetical protein